VLGEFDQDGDLLFRDDLRAVTSLPVTEEKSFCRRKKHRLLLVNVEGRLGVRKEFGDARGRLVQELEALLDLRAHGCAVPAVISADWQANSVTMTYVPGRVLRELLAEAGAKVRNRGNGDAAAGLPEEQRIRSARALLDRVLTDEQVEAIASEMLAVHRAGYVLEDVKYGNIVIQSSNGAPFFIDFERALPISGLAPRLAAYLRDVDRRKFNAHFGTDLQTAKTLRSLAAPPSALDAGGGNGRAEGVYAPAIIRPDIHWGPLWNTDVGIGRWNFIMKDHLPIPRGGSVLDLGANNGFNALQMLRSGAGSAVGVEIDPRAIRQGEFLKQAVEWADNRRYDFSYIEGSHAELPKHGLGRFDLVTALCTLYYVSEQEMRDTVQFLRTITNLVVLQCNTDRLIERSTESTFRKASVEFSLDLLASAGFSRTEVVAPPHYSRPLVIGRSS
jgi:SAM-dependent methyltransferase